MYVDLWGWFWQYERDAIYSADSRRRKMIDLSRQGWQYVRVAQPELAYQSFMEGSRIAVALGEPCWELFFEYWACEVYLYHTDDHRRALDATVKLASRAHQDKYLPCPVRSRVYFILADVYFETDVYSYEERIREALDLIEREIPMDEDTHLRVQHLRAEFDFEFERYQDAEEKVMSYMGQAQDNAFRMRAAHNLLRRTAFSRGDLDMALFHAQQMEHYAKSTESPTGLSLSKLWQASYHFRLGNSVTAHTLYHLGVRLYQQQNLPRWPSYYDACCEYLEQLGEREQVLALRQAACTESDQKQSVYFRSYAYLQHCRTLGRFAQSFEQPLAGARVIATEMTRPDVYLQRLQRVVDGAYYEYDWQKPQP